MVARQSRVDLTRQDSRLRTSCGQSQSEASVARSQLDDLAAIGFRNRSDHFRDEEPLRRHNAAGLSMFYQAGPEKVQIGCETVAHKDELRNGLVFIGDVIANQLAVDDFGGSSERRGPGVLTIDTNSVLLFFMQQVGDVRPTAHLQSARYPF